MCGIIAVVSQENEVSLDHYMGLWSLQHRGKESAGIVTFDGREYHEEKGMGTVESALRDLSGLRGRSGIGHVRYSTTGESTIANAQPVRGEFRGEPFWLAHNGNLVGYEKIQSELADGGYSFATGTDTEVIAALVNKSEAADFESAFKDALRKVSGTYALLALFRERVFGVCDPSGNRPLVIGQGRGITALASESATCDVLGISYLRDIEHGEMVVLDSVRGNWYAVERTPGEKRFCIFEFVYFQRPDTIISGVRTLAAREEMGKRLWREHPVEADIVVAVPDSGNFAAAGVAEESGLPLRPALFRPHYPFRTFIEPLQGRRIQGVRLKLNVIPEKVKGKRVVLVDDSIVRATVMKEVITWLRHAGVKEIHVRISSPPYLHPCYYGIDTYRVKDELIARRLGGNIEEIRREIGADSLCYLSLEGLKASIRGGLPVSFCDACFTGRYHIPVEAPQAPQFA